MLLFIVCTQLNGFKYSKRLDSSIWPLDGTQTGTVTLDQSGPEINDNEEVLHTTQSSRIGASPQDEISYYSQVLILQLGI